MPGAIRTIDPDKKTITLEFTNGQTFGPIGLTPTTDLLTKMIGALEGRLSTLEAKVGR
jgi:hypothetical protein